MRKVIVSIFLYLAVTHGALAQSTKGLELHLTLESPTLELYSELHLRAYLVNRSNTTIKMFTIGGYESGWNAIDERWNGILNGKPMRIISSYERPAIRFRTKHIMKLLPGDSIYAGTFREKIQAAGKYSIACTLSQDPGKIYMQYAANSIAADMARNVTTFSITSKPFEFEIRDVQIKKVEEHEISDTELEKKPRYYDIETAFANPSEVYKLTISVNITDEVLRKVCSLKNLKELYFDYAAGIETFPDQLADLKLKVLKFRGIKKITFPNSLTKLKSLKRLEFSELSITEYPPFIESLTNLEYLSFYHCPISSIPDGILKLNHLKELSLTHTNVGVLNPQISNLSSLEKLDWSGEITSFPIIFGCTNLKYIYLHDYSPVKHIETIPSDIGKLKKLERIDLVSLGLTNIPKEITELKQLKILELNYNKITEIPEYLYECSSLIKIDLSDNNLSIIAPNIEKLSKLEDLNFYHNNIEVLPSGISQCPNVKSVTASQNKIKRNDPEGTILEKNKNVNYRYK